MEGDVPRSLLSLKIHAVQAGNERVVVSTYCRSQLNFRAALLHSGHALVRYAFFADNDVRLAEEIRAESSSDKPERRSDACLASMRRKIVRGVVMMLISVGAMLVAWAAFIWFYDPDGLRRRHAYRPTSRPRRDGRYY